MSGLFLSIGGIIIDDIRLPGGKERRGFLGGGITHAAMGMRIWKQKVGLVSNVGSDFDSSYLEQLDKYFILHGLDINPNVPTPRAWQVFDPDGTRHETFQTDFDQMVELIPKPENLPEKFSTISGVHLHCPPQKVDAWVKVLRERNCPIILWEPWDGFCLPENQAEFFLYCTMVDIVSPNLREGRLLSGLQDPVDILHFFQDNGAGAVALRMAEDGSLLMDHQGDIIHIPAVPVERIVDVTGAGNAYCGGFVVGLSETGELQQAGWYGGVSASCALGQFGALYPLTRYPSEQTQRLAWCRENASNRQSLNNFIP